MPALTNARREAFVHHIIEGRTQAEAYALAGFKPNDSNCNRLFQRKEVQARIKELQARVAKKVVVDQAYVLNSIVDTMERCKQAVPVLDRKGEPVLVETPDGKVAPAYTFMPVSVLKGSELLGKHLGMFAERIEHSGPDGGPIEIADADLARLIAFQLTKASRQAD